MTLLENFLILAGALLVLAKSAELAVKSCIKIAKIMKINEVVIGFLILSVATTLPELLVSTSAILSSDIGLSLGNIFGSNVTNICLIVGLIAIFRPLRVSERSFRKLTSILFLSTLVPLILLNLTAVSKYIGLTLLITFFVFSYLSIKQKISLKGIVPKTDVLKKFMTISFRRAAFLLAVSVVLLVISSRFIVSSASAIADELSILESVIGATLLAVATSFPELSTTVFSIKKGHVGLSLGNAIGACLTNLTLVLGFVLFVGKFAINLTIFSTLIIFTITATVLVWYFLGNDKKLGRKEGIILFLFFIFFIITTFGVQISLLQRFL